MDGFKKSELAYGVTGFPFHDSQHFRVAHYQTQHDELKMKPKSSAANNTGDDDEDAQPKAVNLDEPWVKCKVPNNSPSITEGSGLRTGRTGAFVDLSIQRREQHAALSTPRSFARVYVGLGVVMVDDVGFRGLSCSAIHR